MKKKKGMRERHIPHSSIHIYLYLDIFVRGLMMLYMKIIDYSDVNLW